jgi:hypothetical protein
MENSNRNILKQPAKGNSTDITDPEKDQQKLQQEITTISLPEVKDIPGQEHIRVPRFREMEDTTISSAGEEGNGLLDDLNKEDDDNGIDNISDVTEQERELLRKSAGPASTPENSDFETMALDDTDNEGDKLNEKGLKEDRMGIDLDVPGTELDDEDEEKGEEDEENNLYSQRD